MATLVWTQAEVDHLRAIIASGVEKVRFKDRDVTYQGAAVLKALLADMVRSVDAESSGGTPSSSLVSHSQGWGR